MNYSYASVRYNIENHIKELSGLDRRAMIMKNFAAIKAAESETIPRNAQDKNSIKSLKIQYLDELRMLGWLIANLTEPIGIKPDRLMLFKPIVEELVSKKEIDDSTLLIFKR